MNKLHDFYYTDCFKFNDSNFSKTTKYAGFYPKLSEGLDVFSITQIIRMSNDMHKHEDLYKGSPWWL